MSCAAINFKEVPDYCMLLLLTKNCLDFPLERVYWIFNTSIIKTSKRHNFKKFNIEGDFFFLIIEYIVKTDFYSSVGMPIVSCFWGDYVLSPSPLF